MITVRLSNKCLQLLPFARITIRWMLNLSTPSSDQPWFSFAVSHQRYIIEFGELGIAWWDEADWTINYHYITHTMFLEWLGEFVLWASLGVKVFILTHLRRAEHPVKLNNGGHLHRYFIGFSLKPLISLISLTDSLNLFCFFSELAHRWSMGRLETIIYPT